MMLAEYNPDEWEVHTEHHTCPYHQDHPEDRSWPGCTCYGSSTVVRKAPVDLDATSGDGGPPPPDQHNLSLLKAQAARIEALEEALESISGFCLLHEYGNLGGAETVRRIHGVTDRTLLSTTEPDHE